MRKYLAVAKAELIDAFLNKAEIFLWTLQGVLPVVVFVFLWLANPIQDGKYTLSSLTTYYLLSFLLDRLTGFYFEDTLQRLIKDGELSRYLVKPINLFKYLMAQNLGGKIFHFSFIALPLFLTLVIVLSKQFAFPGILSFLAFLLSIVFAYFVRFFLCLIFSSTAFFTEQSQGMIHFHWMLDAIAGGSLLPLSMYPDWALKIVNILPFRLVFSVPINIFLNKSNSLIADFSFGLLWIVVLFAMTQIIWKSGIKRYSSVGN